MTRTYDSREAKHRTKHRREHRSTKSKHEEKGDSMGTDKKAVPGRVDCKKGTDKTREWDKGNQGRNVQTRKFPP